MLATDWYRKTVITTLVGDVATAYFTLLELDLELAIAKGTLAARDQSRRLIELQQQAGITLLVDLRQAEQLVYGAAQTIPSVEQPNRANRKSNQFAVGQESRPCYSGPPADGAVNTPRCTCWIALLTPREASGHPGSRTELGRGQRQHRLAKAAYFPQISLTGDFGYSSARCRICFRADQGVELHTSSRTAIFTAGRTARCGAG